jgi:hypothetical protein
MIRMGYLTKPKDSVHVRRVVASATIDRPRPVGRPVPRHGRAERKG